MLPAIDLKHLGLIASAGAAVAVRFLSDFSFATILHEAERVGLDVERLSPATFSSVFVNSLRYELQRDWFNLSPQAPPEIVGLVGALMVIYVGLKRGLAPEPAAATTLLLAPIVPLLLTAGACAWVLARTATPA